MATGCCSPALPVCTIAQTRWDLQPSSPNLPSHEIQQSTHATHQAAGRLGRVQRIACTSVLIVVSPVLCSSTNTDISFPFYKDSSVGAGATRLSWSCCSSRLHLLSEKALARCPRKVWVFSQYNIGNREPLFVPGGLRCTFSFPGSQSFSCGDC